MAADIPPPGTKGETLETGKRVSWRATAPALDPTVFGRFKIRRHLIRKAVLLGQRPNALEAVRFPVKIGHGQFDALAKQPTRAIMASTLVQEVFFNLRF